VIRRHGILAGFAIAFLGLALLLDSLGEWPLGFGGFAPIALGVVGVVLIASGLRRRV
jgi:hypothetical protein